MNVESDGVVLHADNGKQMKGSSMLSTMQWLGIAPSFGRPNVSDDNPYAEALFRTLKYRGQIPFHLIDTDGCESRWYGEVFDPTPTNRDDSDMGNGVFGHDANSAWFRNMIVERASGGNLWFSGGGAGGTDVACYDATAMLTSSAADWRVWFRYGGPGGDATGCN